MAPSSSGDKPYMTRPGRTSVSRASGSVSVPELLAAWSAVEIASWDILGKRAGLPVYNLIGGASRERVRIYANGWSRGTTIEEGVERGLRVKAMGFTAAKFDPFPGPWRSFVDRRDEDSRSPMSGQCVMRWVPILSC